MVVRDVRDSRFDLAAMGHALRTAWMELAAPRTVEGIGHHALDRVEFVAGDARYLAVLAQEAVDPLSILRARPIGMMSMLDDEEEDAKIICIHMDDPAFNDYWHIKELPDHRLRELRRFFQDYKALENKTVRVQDFFGPDRAKNVVSGAAEQYREHIAPVEEASG